MQPGTLPKSLPASVLVVSAAAVVDVLDVEVGATVDAPPLEVPTAPDDPAPAEGVPEPPHAESSTKDVERMERRIPRE